MSRNTWFLLFNVIFKDFYNFSLKNLPSPALTGRYTIDQSKDLGITFLHAWVPQKGFRNDQTDVIFKSDV